MYVYVYDVKIDIKRVRELVLDIIIFCVGGICNVFRSVFFVEVVDVGIFWFFFFCKIFVDFIK